MKPITGTACGSRKYAEHFLNSLSDYEKTTGYSYSAAYYNLKRMAYLLLLLGNPQFKVPSLHIAGTKGKGSTANYIAAIMQASGLKTGLYTSPHILTFRERIRLNGKMISWKELAALIKKIEPAVKRLNKETKYGLPTFFEVYTALGFLYFAEKKAGVMVLEAGMGGRLDATNVVRPLVSVFTNISLDHVKELGNTPAKIAKEKAGIIKPGIPVISAPQQKNVLRVLRSAAKKAGSKFLQEGRAFRYTLISLTAKGSSFSFKSPGLALKELKIKMPGKHQVLNASTALAASELAAVKLGLTPAQLKRVIPKALLEFTLPGRIQVIARKPYLLLDAAHNAASAKALLLALKHFRYDRLLLVIGMSDNKDARGFMRVFEREAALAAFVRSSNPRSAGPQGLAEASAVLAKKSRAFENVTEGLKYALMRAGKKDLVCVTDSFYVLHDAVKFLKENGVKCGL